MLECDRSCNVVINCGQAAIKTQQGQHPEFDHSLKERDLYSKGQSCPTSSGLNGAASAMIVHVAMGFKNHTPLLGN